MIGFTTQTPSSAHVTLAYMQALKLEATYAIPAPKTTAKLVSVTYKAQQLLTLWSDGTLQSADIRPRSTALRMRTSQRLPAFTAATTNAQPMESTRKPSKALIGSIGKQSKAKKRRQPEVDSAELQEPIFQSSSSGILPLGAHTVAAVREVTDLPTNGHAASAVEVTVADSAYGCVQSVTSVRLPKAQAGAKLQLMPGSVFQQRTGQGELVLLYGNAVWLFTIPVSLLAGAAAHITDLHTSSTRCAAFMSA